MSDTSQVDPAFVAVNLDGKLGSVELLQLTKDAAFIKETLSQLFSGPFTTNPLGPDGFESDRRFTEELANAIAAKARDESGSAVRLDRLIKEGIQSRPGVKEAFDELGKIARGELGIANLAEQINGKFCAGIEFIDPEEKIRIQQYFESSGYVGEFPPIPLMEHTVPHEAHKESGKQKGTSPANGYSQSDSANSTKGKCQKKNKYLPSSEASDIKELSKQGSVVNDVPRKGKTQKCDREGQKELKYPFIRAEKVPKFTLVAPSVLGMPSIPDLDLQQLVEHIQGSKYANGGSSQEFEKCISEAFGAQGIKVDGIISGIFHSDPARGTPIKPINGHVPDKASPAHASSHRGSPSPQEQVDPILRKGAEGHSSSLKNIKVPCLGKANGCGKNSPKRTSNSSSKTKDVLPESPNNSKTITAGDLRQKGNELYKAGSFSKAIEAYNTALRSKGEDSALLSNLSCAKFEIGNYEGCLDAILRALRGDVMLEKAKQLCLREIKCYFNLGKFADANMSADVFLEGIISDVKLTEEINDLKQAFKWYTRYRREFSKVDISNRLREIPLRRPSHFSHKRACLGYHPRSQDSPESPYVQAGHMDDGRIKPLDLAYFFGGSAHNLYPTLHHLSIFKPDIAIGPHNKVHQNKIHITIADNKPHTIARSLIVLKALSDLAALTVGIQKLTLKQILAEEELLYAVVGPTLKFSPEAVLKSQVWYVYACDIMPPVVHKRMEDIMIDFIEVFTAGSPEEELKWLPCLNLDNTSKTELVAVFRSWIGPGKEQHTVEKLVGKLKWNELVDSPLLEFPSIKTEWKWHKKTLMVRPPPEVLNHEPSLKKWYGKETEKGFKIVPYVKRTWKTNITLFEIENTGVCPTHIGPCMLHPYNDRWTEDPLLQVEELYRSTDQELLLKHPRLQKRSVSIMDLISRYFESCVRTLADPSNRIFVEYRVADMNRTLESVRFGKRRAGFPRTYDALYLSNIPDYSGGSLVTCLYALPLLKYDKGFLSSSVLLNPNKFTSINHLLSSSLAIPDLVAADSLLGLRVCSSHDISNPKCHYGPIRYHRSEDTAPNFIKTAYHTWLYQIFFQIAIPVKREGMNGIIHQPCTLNAWIRLLRFVAERKQSPPKHWLAQAVESMLSGKITTTARPFSIANPTPQDVGYGHPAQAFSTLPWLPEIRTLLCMQATVLPFSFTARPVLSSAKELVEYEISLPNFIDGYESPFAEVLSLIFTHPTINQSGLSGHAFRTLLTEPNEKSSRIVVISSFEWDGETDVARLLHSVGERWQTVNRARFWMETNTMQKLKTEGWVAGLWRVDVWACLNVKEKRVKADAAVKLRTWADIKSSFNVIV